MTITAADIQRVRAILDQHKSSGDLMISRTAHIALIRAAVKDPYERMRLLFNAGVRGPGLAR